MLPTITAYFLISTYFFNKFSPTRMTFLKKAVSMSVRNNNMDKQQLLATIKTGDATTLTNLYKTYRDDFVQWTCRSFYCTEADAQDVFQETMIAFYENVANGKLTELSSSVKTYLFAIGRNLLFKQKRKKKEQTADVEDYHFLSDNITIEDTIKLNERQELIYGLLDNMKEPCRSILVLFYYKRYSIESIANSLGYKGQGVVKNQKVRCLKTLRKLAAEQDELL